jgi:hypothetical protein
MLKERGEGNIKEDINFKKIEKKSLALELIKE